MFVKRDLVSQSQRPDDFARQKSTYQSNDHFALVESEMGPKHSSSPHNMDLGNSEVLFDRTFMALLTKADMM